jgi:hypothetical protein
VNIMPDDLLSPIVRAAIVALDSFGAVTVSEAHVLIGMWCRRRELSDADVAGILGHYDDQRPRAPRALPTPRRPAPGSHRPGITR